jgi:putative membrane protein insertion efficiency factor
MSKWHAGEGISSVMIPFRGPLTLARHSLSGAGAALRQGSRQIAQGLIVAYRLTLAPLIGLNCRHLPGCSEYAGEAIGRFGLWAGGWMALARLCRCHPFGTSGLDFIPTQLPQHARWFLPWRFGCWRGTNADPDRLKNVADC